jgi:hypothetical protein
VSPATTGGEPDWDAREAALWSRADSLPPAERVAVIDALATLAPHLSRYNRSMAANASVLVRQSWR